MVTVPVIAACEHEGRAYRCGEQITLPAVQAAALARLGYVSIVAGYQPKVLEPPQRKRGRPRKNTYTRRDLVAE